MRDRAGFHACAVGVVRGAVVDGAVVDMGLWWMWGRGAAKTVLDFVAQCPHALESGSPPGVLHIYAQPCMQADSD